MQTASKTSEVREAVAEARKAGRTISLALTMGALHEGHLSLIRQARRDTGLVVVSVFVNPTQFGANEDFNEYPRSLDRDAELAERAGADLVFAPGVCAMYGKGFSASVTVGGLTNVLEGKHRPGHFDGVCVICCKLFNLVQPDVAYFGQKDFQQSLVVRRMVCDLDMPLEIRVLPIVREPDGLAMSSRNVRLSEEERKQACCLSRALRGAQEAFAAGERNAGALRHIMKEEIRKAPLAKTDYVSVACPESLAELDAIEYEAVALLAVRFGSTRLIDNAMLAPAAT